MASVAGPDGHGSSFWYVTPSNLRSYDQLTASITKQEGLFTFLFGILSFFLLPRTPSHITFLTEAEKAHINTVLYNDVHTSYDPDHSASSLDEKAERLAFGIERKGSECKAIWGDVWETMKLSHVWLCVLAGFFNGATLSGLA